MEGNVRMTEMILDARHIILIINNTPYIHMTKNISIFMRQKQAFVKCILLTLKFSPNHQFCPFYLSKTKKQKKILSKQNTLDESLFLPHKYAYIFEAKTSFRQVY
jgi:hypothetical protein